MKKIILITLALLFTVIMILNATEVRITTTQRFQGLSSDTKSTTGIRTGSTWYETDTGLTWIFNGTAWAVRPGLAVGDTTSLSAPGYSLPIYSKGYNVGGYLFNITLINTSATLILLGKAGDSVWSAISVDSTIYTSNGGKGLITSNAAVYDSLKLAFHSEKGGSDARIHYNSILAKE